MSTPVNPSPVRPVELESAPVLAEGYASLFRNRQFMALWVGQLFSQLADRIIFVVFITLIVSHFGAQGSLKSMLYVAFTIPAILLTAAAGVFVDRWHRRRTLVMTNVLRAIIVALIPLAIQANNLMALYACAFGISTVTQFFVPAESATIPVVTRSSQLMVANSLFTTTMMGSVIFGFALGDPLIHLFGLKQVHWAIVGLFLISSVALSYVQVGHVRRCNDAYTDGEVCRKESWHAAFGRFFEEMKEGILYLKEDPKVLYKILKLGVLFSYVVAMCIVFISFAETYLYTDPTIAAQKFAWIITFSGVGMVAGAISIGRWMRHYAKGKLVFSGYMIIGLSLLAMTLTPLFAQRPIIPEVFPYLDGRVLFAHTMAVIMGFGAAMVAVPLQSVIHEIIPEDKRGKVMGVQFTLLSTCSTFPVVLAGVGVDMIGVAPMLTILSIPLLLLGGKGLYDRISKGSGADVATW